jgi:hypothetical protein
MNENGDYLINNYVDFIMNNGGSETATPDLTANCYQNAVNADGLYPVNQELYDFLALYAERNNPVGVVDENKFWLAPCYYYTEVILGSRDFPHTLTTLGNQTVPVGEYSTVYYNVKWAATTNPDTGLEIKQGDYTLVCNTPNAVVFFDGTNYFVNDLGEVRITFETDSVNGRVFGFKYFDGTATSGDVAFTLEAAPSGNLNTPLQITGNTATLTTMQWYAIDGLEFSATYQYVATSAGKLTVSTTNEDNQIQITVNDVVVDSSINAEITVETDDKVEIVIVGTALGQTADITLSLTNE